MTAPPSAHIAATIEMEQIVAAVRADVAMPRTVAHGQRFAYPDSDNAALPKKPPVPRARRECETLR